jgi:hypothetical protein
MALIADLLTSEVCFTAMAFSMHTLADWLANQIRPTSPARNSKTISNVTLSLFVEIGSELL